MSNFPDFFKLGYQVERLLGQNCAGGRVTYLATSTNTQLPVVLKQFQFAQTGSNWSDYEAVNQEIQLLRQLNHPSIPRYLDCFETPTGFCLVQEYKPACSLAEPHHWTPEEIKQIAVGVLEVLVYLQSAYPPVFHRDIKPENILVDRQEQLKVTLVDFGFARTGGEELAVSSVVKGTLGFMPPEQLFNRQLTKASDLYSLGATLICLLTQTKSTKIGNLIDEAYRINFKHLVPQLSPQFINWLEKMVAPSLKNRYPNAAAALEALGKVAVVGKATTLGMLACVAKLQITASAAALAALSLVSVLNTTAKLDSALYDPAVDVRHLQATLQCPKCDLQSAYLEDADLSSANLGGADLGGANLERANLERADLAGANLESADLRHAALTRADLGFANLGYANLKRASLGSANLTLANLGGANLKGANLGGVNLTVANLRGANLKGANLGYANLAGANLEKADLRDANLNSANLEDANLKGAKMPDGSIHP